MVQLEIVNIADSGRLVKAVAGLAIVQVCTAVLRQPSLTHIAINLLEGSAIENRCFKALVELLASPSKDGFINLSKVHTRRHTEGVQYNVDRSSVGKEGHILCADNLRYDTLVTMSTCHLIANTKLALHGNIHLGHLYDTTGKVVTYGKGKFVTREAA